MLNCTVTGVTEVYNFTWLHNGEVKLERNSPYTAITHDGLVSELSIHDIPSDEAGNYTCIARISNTIILQDDYILTLQCKLASYTVYVVHLANIQFGEFECKAN